MADPLIKRTEANNVIVQFAGQGEVTEYTDGMKFRSGESNEAFVGEKIRTWEEAQAFAKSQWEKGLKVMTRFITRLKEVTLPEIKNSKRTIVWGPTGDEMDLEKFMAGEVNCWKTYKRESTEGPATVTIFIDTSTEFHRQSEDILWRGAAAIALAHILEEKGYSCEIFVVNGSRLFSYEGTAVMTACCLKRCGDPIDQATLVNTVAGWFYRTVTFTLLDTICAKMNKERASGYGNVYSPNATDLDQISNDKVRIYSSGVFSFDGAVDLMTDEIARIAKDE